MDIHNFLSCNMRKLTKYMIAASILSFVMPAYGQDGNGNHEGCIFNGVPWFDTDNNIVNAHGACIIKENGRYYLFGEWKSDDSNEFRGFSCYSSADLKEWKFEKVVLPRQNEGLMGPGRVGERVKVMKCRTTGEYVMFMHADNLQYKDPYICYATSNTIDGEYAFKGPVLYKGKPIRKWDMGTFQDSDGSGYLLLHGGTIYKLSEDYHSAEELVISKIGKTHGESPAMFKKNDTYFMLFSNLTSWERNDNFYFTARSLSGPWTRQGLFAPEGSLTFNSQTTFVFPVHTDNDTVPIFMGDRWSYPKQASAATYVWMPIDVDGTKLRMNEYWNCWDIETMKPHDITKIGRSIIGDVTLKGENWTKNEDGLASNIEGNAVCVDFNGKNRIAVIGKTDKNGGYAKVEITDKKGKTVYSSFIDFYSKNAEKSIRFVTPKLKSGKYKLEIEVTKSKSNWSDKAKNVYGSQDYYVYIDDIIKI